MLNINKQKELLEDLKTNILLFRRNCCIGKIDKKKIWIIDNEEHRAINILLGLINDCL